MFPAVLHNDFLNPQLCGCKCNVSWITNFVKLLNHPVYPEVVCLKLLIPTFLSNCQFAIGIKVYDPVLLTTSNNHCGFGDNGKVHMYGTSRHC
jgi:hypothetical protein